VGETVKFKTKNSGLRTQDWLINRFTIFSISLSLWLGLASYFAAPAGCLPPPEDTPEEILRTEIILAARSPIDGKPLTATEYAKIEAQLQLRPAPKIDPNIRETIFMLRLRNVLRKLFPFLDF
jgi:hypothetical protein